MTDMGSGLRAIADDYDYTAIISSTAALLTTEEIWRINRVYDVFVTGNEEACVVRCRGGSMGRVGPTGVLWSFKLSGMPNNCGIVISGDAYVTPPLRNRGLGRRLRAVKDAICKEAGFSVVECTTKTSSENQIHILAQDGWVQMFTFLNRRTGNHCIQWRKDL